MAACAFCSTEATDPGKGPSRWARAVLGGEQVLVCPDCQTSHPDWMDRVESCRSCGSKRLYKALGDRVCRTCGYQWSDEELRL